MYLSACDCVCACVFVYAGVCMRVWACVRASVCWVACVLACLPVCECVWVFGACLRVSVYNLFFHPSFCSSLFYCFSNLYPSISCFLNCMSCFHNQRDYPVLEAKKNLTPILCFAILICVFSGNTKGQ